MPKIEFPKGLEGSDDLPRTKQSLQGCFNNLVGQIIATPGINKKGSDTPGGARGAFVWQDSLYGVAGTSLIKITNVLTGAFSTIGVIEGSDDIEWDVGFNDAVIVVKGVAGKIYTLSTTDTLTDISGNANFVPCIDVAHINGRFVYIPFDGDPAFFSDIGAAGTVQAESFFDAESLPDKNNSVWNLRNTLYIGGTDSIESYRDLGSSPVPFQRIQGARLDYGVIGGVLEYSDTFLFIGRAKGQDEAIYAVAPGAATKISNEFIDVLLHDNYTLSELAEAIPGRLKWRGYDLATFKLRSDSFGFYRGNWFKLDTVIDGISRPWSAGFINQLDGEYYSFNNTDFGRFEKINTMYGSEITRIVDIAINSPEGDRFTCSRVELGVSQGFNSGIGSVAIFMSRDGKEFPIPLYRPLRKLGNYEDRLVWEPPGGLGNYIGFMAIRFYTTENVIFNSDSLVVDLHR